MTEEVTLESVQAELERTRAALQARNEEAKNLREAKEAAETKTADIDKYKSQLLQTMVHQNLAGLGVTDSSKLIKYLDLTGVELDENFNVTGLDAKVEQLKEDLPALFDEKQRVGSIDAVKQKAGPKPKLSAEQQAAKDMGLPY